MKTIFLPVSLALAVFSSSSLAQQSGSDLSSILDAEVFYNSDRTLDLRLQFSAGAVPQAGVSLQLEVDPNRSSTGLHCLGTGLTYSSALADFATHCQAEVRDCDAYDGIWYCADQNMVEKPALKIESIVNIGSDALATTDPAVVATDTDTPAVAPDTIATVSSSDTVTDSTPDSASAGASSDLTDEVATTNATECLATATDLASAFSNFARQCGSTAVDCDFHSNLWVCASVPVETLSQSLIEDAVANPSVQPPTIVVTPTPTVTLPAAPAVSSSEDSDSNGRIGTNDLLVLHFDNAPDRDDGHALVAARVLVDTLGLNSVLAVNGTHGFERRNNFQIESEALFQQAWPSGLNAFRDRSGSVATSAALWSNTIAQGNRVWVAEGGPSDFTADVLRAMPASQREMVTVVQHSHGYNEDHTDPVNVQFVINEAVYVRIDNSNLTNNGTADLNRQSDFFVNTALSSQWSGLWQAAFDYLDPIGDKLDFSDTVEVLYLLDIGLDQIANPVDFANRFLR